MDLEESHGLWRILSGEGYGSRREEGDGSTHDTWYKHNEDETDLSIDVDLAGAKKETVELEVGTGGFQSF